MKNDNETVRHFALRVQQLVRKGWCNENAATINLKNNEIFTKRLPKKVKDFAHKRQVKHVSTLLQPSIPFHTLVRYVDSEDIANEKIRTNDLALEINKISIENDNIDKELEPDHIMVTQPRDPNNKSKPAYKKYCSDCQKNNHGVSNCYQKQRDEEYQKYRNPRPRTPQQSFVQNYCSKPSNSQENRTENKADHSSRNNDRNRYSQTYYTMVIDKEIMIDFEVKVEIIHKTTIDLILDKDTTIDPKVHTHLDLDMTTIIKEDLHPDPHIDNHTETTLITDIILDQDIDLALNHKEIPLDDIITHIDLHPNQEITDHDLEHLHRIDNKTESIK